jgi:hypothetical protein
VDGWMGGWVEGWMGGGVDGWMGGWVEGWRGGGVDDNGMGGCCLPGPPHTPVRAHVGVWLPDTHPHTPCGVLSFVARPGGRQASPWRSSSSRTTSSSAASPLYPPALCPRGWVSALRTCRRGCPWVGPGPAASAPRSAQGVLTATATATQAPAPAPLDGRPPGPGLGPCPAHRPPVAHNLKASVGTAQWRARGRGRDKVERLRQG